MVNAVEQCSSFLSLPTELRAAIYEHLIPNDQVSGYKGERPLGDCPDLSPVRRDKQPCCPAILRLNRQIHHEVIGMFYGTAQFFMFIVGCCCHIFGMNFCADDLHTASSNKLPPGFRFIRSLHITITITWPGLRGEQRFRTDSPLPPIPSPPPATTLLADCLSTSSYELRQVTVCNILLFTRLMNIVIIITVEDLGKRFRDVLKEYLAPLEILRGVDFKFDNLGKIGGNRPPRNLARESTGSIKDVSFVFGRLEVIRLHCLRRLARLVSQDD